MSIEEAWKLYLEIGGRTVENRNRIVGMLYGPLVSMLTETLNDKYIDSMTSEAGFVLVREVESTERPLSVRELATLIRTKPLSELDCVPSRVDLVRLAETGVIQADEYHYDREREDWKTGPDSAVDDPTIRLRPYSASLIAAEDSTEATGTEGVLVRESIERRLFGRRVDRGG